MCQHPLHPLLHALPKCEHHIHLEGSLSPTLLFALSKQNHIPLPSATSDPAFASPAALEARYTHFKDLDDFLHYYFIGMSLLITESDFESLAYEYFKRAHAEGVVHAEVFFDPQAHTSRGIKYETVVKGFSTAQQRAEKDFGVTSLLILCFLRNLPPDGANDTFHQALELGHFTPTDAHGKPLIAGIGLDSTELGFPPDLFKDIYLAAEKQGIHRTAHAGEEGGPSYIAQALDECHVQRIDHGVHLADDAALMARVAQEGIMLSVCPLSNVRLRVVKDIKDLPIRKFLEGGVRFSVNSDDPAYFGGYILGNYCALQEGFELSVAEWRSIVENAVRGSWCDDARKGEILGLVGKCIEDFEGGRLEMREELA